MSGSVSLTDRDRLRRRSEPSRRRNDPSLSGDRGYLRSRSLKIAVIVGIFVLSLAAFVVDVVLGSGMLPVQDVITALISPSTSNELVRQVVWDLRLPASIAALLVGMALAASGAGIQTILNNPLAEPYTLGIATAAGFGAAVAAVVGTGSLPFGSQIYAFVFALLSSAALLALSKLRNTGTQGIVLLGIAFLFLFTALTSLMQLLATQEQLKMILFWSLGSLARADWTQLGVLAVIIAVVLPFFYANSWKLTAFRLGEERAISLGVHTGRVKTMMLVGMSLLVAAAVAIAGSIGFIGLISPHIARMLVGEDHRYFLTASVALGMLLMVAGSILSKVIAPGLTLPIGIVTAIVGVPVFFVMILSANRRAS